MRCKSYLCPVSGTVICLEATPLYPRWYLRRRRSGLAVDTRSVFTALQRAPARWDQTAPLRKEPRGLRRELCLRI